MERIGIIGLGRMGSAMAQRYAGQGVPVTGWTRSGRAVDGVPAAPDLATLTRESDVLMLSLFDGDAAAETLDALLTLPLDGKLIAETSTIVPSVVKTRADRIAAAGAQIVDAPISGGPELVTAGQCGVFIGGEAAAAQRAERACNPISNRIFHVGPLGTGMVMKTINNAVIQTYISGLAEQLQVARGGGLAIETALTILCGGPGGIPLIRDRIPKILGEDDSVGFTVSGMYKDNAVFRAVAEELGVATPTLDQFEGWITAAIAAGLEDADGAAILARAYRAHD
jgi:3-hydroxyisobutyrate dehydrogenase